MGGEQRSEVLLRPPAHRVAPRARLMWTGTAMLRAAVLLAAFAAMGPWWHWFAIPAWLWVLLGLICLGYVGTMPTLRWVIHRWEATTEAVYTQTGWLTRERRIAPMSRVQTVDFSQNPLARLLGLASVRVTTASAAGPVHIHGLALADAERLVADLTRRTQDHPGDAT